MGQNEKSTAARRRLLKSIAAAGGIAATGKMLPENWKRPIVDSALLPAHAQTSPAPVPPQPAPPTCTEQCTISVQLDWTATGNGADADLLLETPGGTTIDPKGTTASTCLQHDGDTGVVVSGTETISTIGSGVNPGTYTVYVRNNTSDAALSPYSITVSGTCGASLATGSTLGPSASVTVGTFDVPAP